MHNKTHTHTHTICDKVEKKLRQCIERLRGQGKRRTCVVYALQLQHHVAVFTKRNTHTHTLVHNTSAVATNDVML